MENLPVKVNEHRVTTISPHPVPLAPASTKIHPQAHPHPYPGLTAEEFPILSPNNCQACVRKKVKCNRTVPRCASCAKTNLECAYQPRPPRRKRKRSQSGNDIHERLARYERILYDHNLLPAAGGPIIKDSSSSEISAGRTQPQTPHSADTQANHPTGDPVPPDSNPRYIDSVLLLDAGEGDLCELADCDQEESDGDGPNDEEPSPAAALDVLAAQSIAGAILGSTTSLTKLHPSHGHAMKLWHIYVENVEPLCKVLHVPTIAKMVATISKSPGVASKNDECVLFVIYYFAVFSLSNEDCLREFGDARTSLVEKYRTAVPKALVNASWLKTTAMPVLQAFTLFLIALRTQIGSHTFWILTGIAIRMAQRIGLHNDRESQGLSPFLVQMRRRLFWQIVPLDSYAGQTSGTGISVSPETWDTKQPLNIDDDQIFPGMTEVPSEQRGASEMIFCLSRMELSNFYNRTGVKLMDKGGMVQMKNREEIERLIDEVEDRIELKYLRYCDILNPLHLVTTGMTRSAVNAARLRARMPLLMQESTSDEERRKTCILANKVLDTISAMLSNPALQKFRWQIQAFFLWDSLLCLLRCISKVGFYSPPELDSAWKRVFEVYANHETLLLGRRNLFLTIGKITLDAWQLNPSGNASPEPSFITSLRAQREPKGTDRRDGSVSSTEHATDGAFFFDELFGDMNNHGPSMSNAFEGDSSSDWLFWDQMYGGTSLT